MLFIRFLYHAYRFGLSLLDGDVRLMPCFLDTSPQEIHELYISNIRPLRRLAYIDVVNTLQQHKVSEAGVA